MIRHQLESGVVTREDFGTGVLRSGLPISRTYDERVCRNNKTLAMYEYV